MAIAAVVKRKEEDQSSFLLKKIEERRAFVPFCSKWVNGFFALCSAEGIEKMIGLLNAQDKGRKGMNLRRWSREQRRMFTAVC